MFSSRKFFVTESREKKTQFLFSYRHSFTFYRIRLIDTAWWFPYGWFSYFFHYFSPRTNFGKCIDKGEIRFEYPHRTDKVDNGPTISIESPYQQVESSFCVLSHFTGPFDKSHWSRTLEHYFTFATSCFLRLFSKLDKPKPYLKWKPFNKSKKSDI